MSSGIKVFAPASTSNLACGFDSLGIALEKPGDNIIFRKTDSKGLKITKIIGADRKLPTDIQQNTAGVAAMALLKHVDMENIGIDMEIHKNMPSGSGLGSSAASAAAAVLGINTILNLGLTKRELLPFAVQGEMVASGSIHADNIAPSLLGGMIFIRDNQSLDIYKLPYIPGIYLAMVHPNITIMTKEARAILSPTITLKQHIQQAANLAAFVLATYTSDIDLLSKSIQDVVIEPQRAGLIPHFYEVKEAALNQGALGCSISGAGPSLFALCSNSLIADEVAITMKKTFENHNIQASSFVSPINHEGAIII
ncbi:MAG: homoserine kinase [Saprospiraceae bacterium]|jgi:homoserine kinase|nr:homoserine kinase [Saprospiraceae bacterium]MCA0334223.1 homoserine kinase [Bacteroidota bacterium]MCB0605184.1 homoserine kinase [Saprospiraceae bacterium]MCO5278893.1 homoserine kinase [Saprospiraceae bacterium]HQU95760.1 homoserine kinase [Saprospiraceae bacterium]